MDSFSTQVELCRSTLASGPLRLTIRGTSMLPTLRSGDAVIGREAALADLQPGDVAVFVRNRHLVAHRVVKRTAALQRMTIITRGDAQLHDDPPLAASELLGIVTAVSRRGTWRLLSRRLSATARCAAWVIKRSNFVRLMLDRVNAFVMRRTRPVSVVMSRS